MCHALGMTSRDWPELLLADWEPTYLTLHRWTQIVGKIRLAHAAWLNHWWHSPLYVSSYGLTTSSMPIGGRQLTITFDFCAHRLVAHTSDGRFEAFALAPMPVAEFYDRVRALLSQLDVPTRIWPKPVEVVDTTPFNEDRLHSSYDRAQVEALHRILMNVDRVFALHRGRFVGKSSPVHFFWGAFDLAVTRFSGRPNPAPPPDPTMAEAYSHEVISHGFWPGGDWPVGGRVEEAVFYAYAVPEPAGFRTAPVRPAAARYAETLGEYLLPYAQVRVASDPDAMLLEFMESTYRAAAERAGWDVAALEHPRAASQKSGAPA
jgi:hypothetical protein